MSEEATLEEFRDKSEDDQRQDWRRVELGEVSWKRSENVDPQEVDIDRHVGLEHIEPNNPSPNWELLDDLSSTKRRFSPGDVLFAKLRPNLEKSAQPDFEGVSSTDIFPIVAEQGINSKYLLYRLSSKPAFDYARRTSAGTRMPRTSWNLFSNFEFDLPPLIEQRNIATVLYTVDRAIEETEEIIEQSKRVSSGIKQDTLTTGLEDSPTRNVRIVSQEVEVCSQWDMVPLPRIAEKGDDSFTDGDWVESEDMVENGEYQLIQLGNVGEGRFKGESNRYVDQDFFESENCTLVEKGDLLISRMAEPILRTVIVPEFEKKSITAVDIVVAKVDETEWDKRYLTYLLNTKTWENIAEALASGSTRKRISRENMGRILVPKPDIDVQKDIADVIESVECLTEVEREYRQQLQRLKYGLMEDLLSGTVRTTDTNIEVPDEIAQHG